MARGKKTIADRVAEFGRTVRARLASAFDRLGVAYPPQRVTLVGLKTERTLQVWVSGPDKRWKHLKDYPILGMSGSVGPKLKEGDMQVPEGIYRVESLNPNSLYHLALRVNYPNLEDRRRAKQDGRKELGSDIMIHGKGRSIGCLAMGDEAAEDLFVLAAETGIDNVSVILCPVDFRCRTLPTQMPSLPQWAGKSYESIKKELLKL
jgi:murein L,D-transpeptidase YafK